MPSVADHMHVKRRRTRKSMAAINATKGAGWRLVRTRTARAYDQAHARLAADVEDNQSRDALAAWANEGGAK